MKPRSVAKLGVFSAAAIAAYVAESIFPTPVPWARIGISNVVVVIALFAFGLRQAVLVNSIRVIIGNLLTGGLLGVGFILSLLGSTVSTLTMGVLRSLFSSWLSVVGVSSVGASVNNLVQVMIFGLMVGQPVISKPMLGAFLLMGVGVGLVTGLIASFVMARLKLENRSILG